MDNGVLQRHHASRGGSDEVHRRKTEMLDQRMEIIDGVARLLAAVVRL